MKKLLLFLTLIIAFGTSAQESGEKELKLKVSTLSTSDSVARGSRPQDGEQPVQPLNISIGTASLKLFGYAQTQYELTHSNHETDNSFNISRVILMADAKLTRRLGFFLMLDVASRQSDKLLHEYWAQYEFMPELKVKVGQFKTPYTMENILSPTVLGVVNITEGTRYMAGIAGDPLYGNWAGRDMGIVVTGDAVKASDGHRYLNYTAGVMNGAGMNRKDNNSHKDVVAMLNVLPLKDLTFSASMILGKGHALTGDGYGIVAEGENYRRTRWAAGAEWRTRPVMLRSEFMWGRNGAVHNRAAYAEAWIHTLPKLDVVCAFDHLNKFSNCKSDLDVWTKANNYVIGLQYWLYKKCRISSQYIYRDPNAGHDSHMWVTQFQVAF